MVGLVDNRWFLYVKEVEEEEICYLVRVYCKGREVYFSGVKVYYKQCDLLVDDFVDNDFVGVMVVIVVCYGSGGLLVDSEYEGGGCD